MRLFALLNFQDLMAALFPTLLFMVVFGVGLAFMHLKSKDSDARKATITGRFADDLSERNAPYPLIMVLIIVGTFLWGFFYILMHGLLGVKI
jgi:hypothetical protein